MRRYLDLLRIPGAAAPVAGAALGRLPYGMFLLAEILLLRAQGLSYAAVGVVSGSAALAVGLTLPLLGRLVDRLGQTAMLVASACVSLAANVSFVAAALSGAGVLPLTLLAVAAGGSTPPLSPCMRTLWPELAGDELLHTAYAFDALQIELFFILGPLLAAALAGAISPQAAFVVAASMEAAGALAFAAAPASRRWRPAHRAGGARIGALSTRGMRVLVVVLTIVGISFGVLEISIPAFAEQEGSRSDSGWLFALWSAGSLAGALVYGSRDWGSSSTRRLLLLSGALALGLAPLPFAGSLAAFAALLAVAGLGLAPSEAAGYTIVGELTPAGAMTEAYAWQIVASVAGGAVGAWLAGTVVERISVEAALACAPLAATAGLLVALAGRRSLATRPPAAG
jgi:MFS family permease